LKAHGRMGGGRSIQGKGSSGLAKFFLFIRKGPGFPLLVLWGEKKWINGWVVFGDWGSRDFSARGQPPRVLSEGGSRHMVLPSRVY